MTLVLSRKVNESIRIGNSCEIIVARFDTGKKVRLAVKSPKFIHVCRNEVFSGERILPLGEQLAASVIDCLRLNGIDDRDHTIAICDLCNSMIDVIGGLRNAS